MGAHPVEKDGKKVVPFDRTDERSLMVKDFMKDVTNFMKNGYLLRDVINLFNTVNFDNSNESLFAHFGQTSPGLV